MRKETANPKPTKNPSKLHSDKSELELAQRPLGQAQLPVAFASKLVLSDVEEVFGVLSDLDHA